MYEIYAELLGPIMQVVHLYGCPTSDIAESIFSCFHMRPITWLHISDFHFREEETWAQNTVSRAMLDNIHRRCENGLKVDFVLATGDLAYSGDEAQYLLVRHFLRDLSTTANLPLRMIYCVPGNHDVIRNRKKTCFLGARQLLQSENDVYAFLADIDERQTLMLRQEHFTTFQEDFFSDQDRTRTEDDLGFVSTVEIDDLRIAILGINSAWLSEGGPEDERHILIGEHQVENAIRAANNGDPHITIAMQHHPFDYLQRFDQRSTQCRLEQACNFIHSGHLHEPQAAEMARQSSNCLVLAAGASYESRNFRNAYTIISFDPVFSHTTVTFVQYAPSEGSFSYESVRSYHHAISAGTTFAAGDVAAALEQYCDDAKKCSHYLASVLVGHMSDVPVRMGDTVFFGTVGLENAQVDPRLHLTTEQFVAVGKIISLLHGRKTLEAILNEHGGPVVTYIAALLELTSVNENLSEQLKMRNVDARRLAGIEDGSPFANTVALMEDLLAAGDWDKLRSLAERCVTLEDEYASARANRMLALCLARSHENCDRDRAKGVYAGLMESAQGEAADWAGLATLLTDDGEHHKAKSVILKAIATFPEKAPAFAEIGMKVVAATGDLAFRDRLRA